MSDYRKIAHLVERIGEERWQALISSDNTGKVKEFCDGLIALPDFMTVRVRTYDILPLTKDQEVYCGEDDREYIIADQQDINVAFRGRVHFVFKGEKLGEFTFVYWNGSRWTKYWDQLLILGDSRDEQYKILRRKQAGTGPVGIIR